MKSQIPICLPTGATSITKVTLWVIDGGKVEREIVTRDVIDDCSTFAYRRAEQDLIKMRDELQFLLSNGESLCPFHPSKFNPE